MTIYKPVKEANYLLMDDGRLKAVVSTKSPVFNASLRCSGREYADFFNDDEPYDRLTHVFYIESALPAGKTLTFCYTLRNHSKNVRKQSFAFEPVYADKETLLREYDSGTRPEREERETVADGVEYTHYFCKNKEGAPVHVFSLSVDTEKATIYTGTPEDGYMGVGVRAKVPQMIDAAVKNGVNVVAAMNGDFFDMFGDAHPAGLCVKNGRVIANEDSKRYFLGAKKDGTPVIASLAETPALLRELEHAVSGLQLIVKDGRINDWSPLEPFAYVRHPRTAAGVTKDGKILLLEVDGRIPDYSNGATLVDLAKMMIALGADRAVNLDGGGSSVTYTKEGGRFVLRSNPADLFRPTAKLIRKEYNCILVVKF